MMLGDKPYRKNKKPVYKNNKSGISRIQTGKSFVINRGIQEKRENTENNGGSANPITVYRIDLPFFNTGEFDTIHAENDQKQQRQSIPIHKSQNIDICFGITETDVAVFIQFPFFQFRILMIREQILRKGRVLCHPGSEIRGIHFFLGEAEGTELNHISGSERRMRRIAIIHFQLAAAGQNTAGRISGQLSRTPAGSDNAMFKIYGDTADNLAFQIGFIATVYNGCLGTDGIHGERTAVSAGYFTAPDLQIHNGSAEITEKTVIILFGIFLFFYFQTFIVNAHPKVFHSVSAAVIDAVKAMTAVHFANGYPGFFFQINIRGLKKMRIFKGFASVDQIAKSNEIFIILNQVRRLLRTLTVKRKGR